MQQTFGLKRFALNHIGGTALAFGVLVSSLTVATTLSVTGDFPGRSHAESARVATSGSPLGVTAAVAEQRQLRMDRDDFVAWRRQTASVVATSSMNAAVEQMAALIEAKQARLEADELHASTVTTQSVAHENLLRFYAHKEERLLALSTPAEAASNPQAIQRFDRADAIAALRATPRMDAAPDGCSCPPAEPWTLLDDLTPVRVWR